MTLRNAAPDAAKAHLLSVIARLEPFDRTALLAALSGLALMPENASRHLRLNTLIELAASLPADGGKPDPDANQLRRLVNSAEVRDLVGMLEDPAEYPLTEPVFFEGRAHVLFTGQQEEGGYRLSRLVDVFDRAEAASPFGAAEPYRLIKAALHLSSAVAVRAEIGLGVPAESPENVHVDGSIGRLSAAVRWTVTELDGVLSPAGTDRAALKPLTVVAGAAGLGEMPLLDELSRRPIVSLPDGSVVVVPGLLASALSHALISWVHANGLTARLATEHSLSVAASVAPALTDALRIRPLDPGLATPPLPDTVHELVSEIDSDAAMVVMVVGDRFATFDPSKYGEGEEADTAFEKAVADRVAALEAWLLDPARPYERVVEVFLGATAAGRWFSFGIEHKPAAGVEMLVLSPSALEIIAFNEARDPLAFWRYARSLAALYEKTHVQSTHPLDQYSMYSTHGHSFYMSDGRRPTGIFVAPGMGLDQRQKFLDRTRRQSAEFPSGEHIEIWASYEGPAPIFFPRHPRGQACRLVRLEGVDVWVLGAPWSMISSGLRSLYEDVANAAAYWIWQAGGHVIHAARAHGGGALPGIVTIFLRLDEPAEWEGGSLPTDEPRSSDITHVVKRDERSAFIDLDPHLRGALAGALNRGERHLCGVLAHALLDLLDVDDPDLAITGPIVQTVAPVGQRKMLLMFDSAEEYRIGSDDGLPNWPKVSEWEDDQILDELAAELARIGRSAGQPGTRDEQNQLARHAVAFFHNQLEVAVAELSPTGLLEDLLRTNEALLRETSLRRLLIPTRIACFGQHSDIAAMIRTEMHEMSRASLGHRFLMEYVAARPPSGAKPLTRSRYARMLALAAIIVDYGFLSDVVKFELAETAVHILDSGRLGASQGVLHEARESFMDRAIPEHVRAAQAAFADHWPTQSDDPSGPPDGWEDAFIAEFGYPISDLAQLLGELAARAFAVSGHVTAKPEADLRAHLATELGWDSTRVDRILADLTIVPRADFLAPAGFRKEDVYPWRYNRRYSVLRRPLLVRTTGSGSELVWGARTALLAGEYLLDLLLSGRLAATSAEMQALKAGLSDAAGKEFVADVASRMDTLGFLVRTNVTKIGRIPIADDGQDLGDVDVLGVDHSRRVLWAVECKNLGVARTPWELWSEVREFEEPTKGIVAKHQRRAQGLGAHLDDIVSWLGLSAGKWRVEPVIVVKSAMMSLHMREFTIPVIDSAALEEHVARPAASVPAAAVSQSVVNLALRPKAKKRRKKRR